MERRLCRGYPGRAAEPFQGFFVQLLLANLLQPPRQGLLMHHVQFNGCFAAFNATSWHLQCKFGCCHFLSTPSLMFTSPMRASLEEGRKGSGFVPAWPAQHVLCVLSWVFHQHNSHLKRATGPGSVTDSHRLKILWKQAQNYTCTKCRHGSGRGCCPHLCLGEVLHHSSRLCAPADPPKSLCASLNITVVQLFIPFLLPVLPWSARQNDDEPCLEGWDPRYNHLLLCNNGKSQQNNGIIQVAKVRQDHRGKSSRNAAKATTNP